MMRETPNSFYNSLVIDMRKMSCYDVGGHVSSRDIRVLVRREDTSPPTKLFAD